MASCCVDLKSGQVWVCESCGLEIKIVKECDCSKDASKVTCESNACLTCCERPLKLKG